MSNILKILHPFIPFFTESLWQKNKYDKFFNTPLIQADWSKAKNNSKFNKNHKDIVNIIEIISNIRSTKAELNITPKLFCDIVFTKKSKNINKLIDRNIEIIKQVGRVDKLLLNQNRTNNTIDILVLKEKLALKFNEDIDISFQKNRILDKIKNLDNKIKNLSNKLKNKAYLKNAPKNIVQNDRILLSDLMIEENKLTSIVSSIS
jgi:valyl-tRNA synthetase